MPTHRTLRRDSEIHRVAATTWAQALALALKYEWNPNGPSTSYLADGFTPTEQQAAELSNAWDNAFEAALSAPMRFYPVAIDMGELSLLSDFVREGSFVIGTEQ